MTKFLILFFLFISSSLYGEDISNFEIEGVSVGSSLLEFYNKKEIIDQIEENKDRYLNNILFGEVFLNKNISSYDSLTVFVKSNDPKFIIHSISGSKKFDNIDLCINEKKNIISEFDNIFDDALKTSDVYNYDYDSSGNSKIYETKFTFISDNEINIQCIELDEKYSKNKNWWKNTLYISIDEKEFLDWLYNL